ncbi:MAG TPA: hypothetical protein VHC46_07600, partial [Thermodesulfobacteriota bacterium]|nr:hypothetical protein [Thermodesulfobacteriota bacterium]
MRFVLIIAAFLCAAELCAYASIQQDVIERDTIGGGGGGGGGLSSSDIDTFAELDAIVTDEGLVNLNDAQTLLNKVIDGNSNTIRMLRAATDCTSFAGAVDGQYCWEQDDNVLYVCETADECDTPGEWNAVASAASLDDLTDVTITDPQDNDILRYDTGAWVNAALGSLADLNALLGGISIPDTGTLNNDGICTWDAAGSEIDCATTNAPTASALASNPTDCSANQYATTIAANGNLTCAQVSGSQVTNTPAGNIAATTVQAAIDELDTEKPDRSKIKSLFVFRPTMNEPPASNFATIDTRNSHPVLDFDGSTNESAVFTFVMPQAYSGGGVTVYIHYAMTSATSGDIDWDVSFERVGDQQQDMDSDSFA